MSSHIRGVLDFDFNDRAARYYSNLGQYRVLFFLLFGLGIFTYYLFVSDVLLHNHSTRFPWMPAGGIGSGRWFSEWIGHLHYNADLPVFLPVVSIVCGAVASLLFVRGWHLILSPLSMFLVAGAVITYPANLAFFYYTFMTPLFLGSALLCALAYATCDRFSPWRIGVASIFILLALATYQMNVNVIITAAVAAVIGGIMLQPSVQGIRNAFVVAGSRALAVVIGGIAYRLSLAILGQTPPRSIAYTSLSEVPARTWEIVQISYQHLLLTQPELMTPIKMLLLGFVIAAVILSVVRVRRSPFAIIAVLALWVVLVPATKALFLAVEPDGSYWEYRFNLALGLLYAFSIAVVLSAFSQRLLASVAQVVAAVVVITFVQANHMRQGVLWRGQVHDLALANRILQRIEALPDLDYSKRYNLVRVGRGPYYRENLIKSRGHQAAYDVLGDSHMDTGVISDVWVDHEVFELLGSAINLYSTVDFQGETTLLQEEGVLASHPRWPAPDSVFIYGDMIVVYL